MVAGLDAPQLVAIAAALGWASGLRLSAVPFFVGMEGWTGRVELPPGLQLLQHPLMLAASGALLSVEFFADEIPGVEMQWEVLHTLPHILAGAALIAFLGGTPAATNHFAKATSRAAVNTSPEPFTNIGLSLAGDAAVPAAL